MHPKSRSSDPRAAFTLIELLVVIAIIGILAAILIPTVGAARVSANRAKTKTQFSQWATAMEQFKQEYGYYPRIDGGSADKLVVAELFSGALTGRQLDGTEFTTNTDVGLCGNKRKIAFYSISESELNSQKLALFDAFGNTSFVVFYDKNGDGIINAAGEGFSRVKVGDLIPTEDEITSDELNKGIRAGVIFYSPGRGTSAEDIVFSWK